MNVFKLHSEISCSNMNKLLSMPFTRSIHNLNMLVNSDEIKTVTGYATVYDKQRTKLGPWECPHTHTFVFHAKPNVKLLLKHRAHSNNQSPKWIIHFGIAAAGQAGKSRDSRCIRLWNPMKVHFAFALRVIECLKGSQPAMDAEIYVKVKANDLPIAWLKRKVVDKHFKTCLEWCIAI